MKHEFKVGDRVYWLVGNFGEFRISTVAKLYKNGNFVVEGLQFNTWG